MLHPGHGGKTNRQRGCFPRTPRHDGSLDQAGVLLHQSERTFEVACGFLLSRSQCAPGSSFSIEYLVHTQRFTLGPQLLWRDALFFEVVEHVFQRPLGKPGHGFFDSVAIGNAVQGNLGLFHGRNNA